MEEEETASTETENDTNVDVQEVVVPEAHAADEGDLPDNLNVSEGEEVLVSDVTVSLEGTPDGEWLWQPGVPGYVVNVRED